MVRGSGRLLWPRSHLEAPHARNDKAVRVRGMFDAIAPTYELINALASLGRDGYWRREMVRLARVRPDDVLLDVACGSGDVVRTFAEARVRPARLIGVDFSPEMLKRAAGRPVDRGAFCQGDALRLPVAAAGVTITTCAFGLRNFQDLGRGLAEMYRVLRAGGRAVVLEFSIPPRPVLRRLYLAYVNHLMPMAATILSRDRTGAYRYLPRSVVSFPEREALASCFKAAGFAHVAVHPLSWGIVSVYVAFKTDDRVSVKP